MTLYQQNETVRDFNGVVVSKAIIKVVAGLIYSDTAPLATLYADSAGLVPLTNPFQADAAGQYSYWIDLGFFSEQVSRPGYYSETNDGMFFGGTTGTPGPQGPAGLPGPQGAKGDQGAPANYVRSDVLATAGQTLFTVPTYVLGAANILVFKNGLLKKVTTDYTETSPTSITLTSGASLNDPLTFMVGAPSIGDSGAQLRFDLANPTLGDNLVATVQHFTGAVARTQDGVNSDRINALDFGAKGDYVHDDTAYLQAAINAALLGSTTIGNSNAPRTGPVELFIPAGCYKITAPLVINRTIRITGEGTGEWSAGTRIHQVTPGNDLFTVDPQYQGCSVQFRNMALISTGDGSAGCLIHVKHNVGGIYCNSSRILNCAFGNAQNACIYIEGGDDWTIDQCTFDSGPLTGIVIGQPYVPANHNWECGVSNFAITNNDFFDLVLRCILLENTQGSGGVIANNRVSHESGLPRTTWFIDAMNGGGAPYLAPLAITGNVVEGCDYAMDIYGLHGVSVTGNVFKNLGCPFNLNAPFHFAGDTQNIVISGNMIQASTGALPVISGNVNGVSLMSGNQFQNNVPPAWVTNNLYFYLDRVTVGGKHYYCVTSHGTGTWIDDLAAGKWRLCQNVTPVAPTWITGHAYKAATAVTVADMVNISLGLTPTAATVWGSAVSYTSGNKVTFGVNTYVCLSNHTSGTFATDFAAGKWAISNDLYVCISDHTSGTWSTDLSGGKWAIADNAAPTTVAALDQLSGWSIKSNNFTQYPAPSVSETFLGAVGSQGVISSLATKKVDFTLLGARQGDIVSFNNSDLSWTLPGGFTCFAWVSANNTVSFQYTNTTGGNVGLSAHNWNIKVER